MRKAIKLLVLVFTSTFLFQVYGDFAFSGSSENSLVISNQRYEDTDAYYLMIYIEGIKSSDLKTNVRGKTLFVSAQKGGVVSNNAIAGAQLVNYAFDFEADADMNKLKRSNQKNKVVITIPKSP